MLDRKKMRKIKREKNSTLDKLFNLLSVIEIDKLKKNDEE